jgi:hypothetical protein
MDAASVCPLCGGPNACGVAAGKGVCWCFSVEFPEHALSTLPEAQRMQSCVCERCVEAGSRARERQMPDGS